MVQTGKQEQPSKFTIYEQVLNKIWLTIKSKGCAFYVPVNENWEATGAARMSDSEGTSGSLGKRYEIHLCIWKKKLKLKNMSREP